MRSSLVSSDFSRQEERATSTTLTGDADGRCSSHWFSCSCWYKLRVSRSGNKRPFSFSFSFSPSLTALSLSPLFSSLHPLLPLSPCASQSFVQIFHPACIRFFTLNDARHGQSLIIELCLLLMGQADGHLLHSSFTVSLSH